VARIDDARGRSTGPLGRARPDPATAAVAPFLASSCALAWPARSWSDGRIRPRAATKPFAIVSRPRPHRRICVRGSATG